MSQIEREREGEGGRGRERERFSVGTSLMVDLMQILLTSLPS